MSDEDIFSIRYALADKIFQKAGFIFKNANHINEIIMTHL